MRIRSKCKRHYYDSSTEVMRRGDDSSKEFCLKLKIGCLVRVAGNSFMTVVL